MSRLNKNHSELNECSPLPAKDAKGFLKEFTDVSGTIPFELSSEENYPVFINKKGKEYSLADLLTEFASFRPQETVEIKRNDINYPEHTIDETDCPKCGNPHIMNRDAYCGYCGSKINWK